MMLTHGDTSVVRRERMRGHFMGYVPLWAVTYPPSLPGIARRKTRVNALTTRQSIFLSEALLFDGCQQNSGLPEFCISSSAASRVNPTCGVKPGHDESRTTAVGTGPFKASCMLPSLRHSSPRRLGASMDRLGRSMNRLALLLAATVLFTAESTAAQSVPEFYAGRQITFIVGASTGGGYDRQARLVARHLGKHLPGTPTIIVQNMPGAGSLAATNYIYNAAAKD